MCLNSDCIRRHVGLRWVSTNMSLSVSDQSCRSPMKNVAVSDQGMSVSDGFPIGLDSNNIFVNTFLDQMYQK